MVPLVLNHGRLAVGRAQRQAMVRTTWQMDPPIVASGPAAKWKVELPEITFPFEVHGYRDGVGVEVCNALMRVDLMQSLMPVFMSCTQVGLNLRQISVDT